MKIVDTHIHSIFRPTQFFENYHQMGVEKVISVAFYPIKPRYSETLEDLFRWMYEREPMRLKSVGIDCYCGIGIHPRSIPENIDNRIFQTIKEMMKLPDVVCLAEIGLEKGSPDEERVLEEQLSIAKNLGDFPVILHTPGKNKKNITRRLIEVIESLEIKIGIIDHVSLENIDLAIETDLMIGLTVQKNKLPLEELLEIIYNYNYQTNRFLINSDVGIDIADKFSVPNTVEEMQNLGIADSIVSKISYQNAENFFKIA